ncbi:MAG: glycine--tRNA ligase [Candidatus Lloydbacteria bacterium RIFOXYC12_FULL_46_25]|uniref:glycine--tRNA ligase n=1 Tax=Candidatus Lloydbacteria bacterium RIFOXYC12_FULL_46_25 TaxID=1798670 RepID=A0A1G2E4V1_9BACT|nr:MAG: glycine--tRNA ligase [Candidatus Lloydbacteria bacterium RIFOXYC12_FULL_46_25]
MAEGNEKMEEIIALAKRRGFIYQGSEIYGGLAGTWDYGPLGVALKNNITNLWWKMFVDDREDMYGIDAAILMNPRAWVASGHVGGFSDPLVEDLKTKKRYRADHLLEESGIDPKGMSVAAMDEAIKKNEIKSPEKNPLGEVRQFNMMFATNVGATEDAGSVTYLRPETAGGMFVNYKNVVDSFHPKLPFGLAQIGKAFRNEIAPRDFIFRVRELEQMEIEYFVRPADWEVRFEEWRMEMWRFIEAIGLTKERVHELEVGDGDRAHYSKRTIDFEYDFPFGRKELYGLAYRSDFDLKSHQEGSKVNLEYFDEEVKEKFLPHVIEPSFGLGRTLLAVLSEAYTEDEMGDEKRVYLKFNPRMAPIKAAVSPLLKNKPELVQKAREVYAMLKKDIPQIMWDDNGNIGKRYRRQDEIGTPFCVVIDFDTLGEKAELLDTVTIRDRDTGTQQRLPIAELLNYIKAAIK